MWSILHIAVTSLLAVVVVPRTGKSLKNDLSVLKEKRICYNYGILHFVF